MQNKFITRFAPSPTGHLHLGHGFSALLAFTQAQNHVGQFLLRIEDIDQTRARDEFIDDIYKDLLWLGIHWESPVRQQSAHFDDYQKALDHLAQQNLLYPCFCTRAEIKKELENAQSAPHGVESALYPQTCLHLSPIERAQKIDEGRSFALRLNVDAAIKQLKEKNLWPLFWVDAYKGKMKAAPEILGDVILARKETPTSYHLAVTVDDHLAGITHIIRGVDLFEATHIHRLLQALLGFDTPEYAHHPLLFDQSGERLAKRKNAPSLKALRENGVDGLSLAKTLLAIDLKNKPITLDIEKLIKKE